jgi:hypothetical protein
MEFHSEDPIELVRPHLGAVENIPFPIPKVGEPLALGQA